MLWVPEKAERQVPTSPARWAGGPGLRSPGAHQAAQARFPVQLPLGHRRPSPGPRWRPKRARGRGRPAVRASGAAPEGPSRLGKRCLSQQDSPRLHGQRGHPPERHGSRGRYDRLTAWSQHRADRELSCGEPEATTPSDGPFPWTETQRERPKSNQGGWDELLQTKANAITARPARLRGQRGPRNQEVTVPSP